MEADFEETDQRTPLEKFAVNLTQEAQEGKLDPVVGRDQEILRCVNILARRRKNTPVLIGDPGVGKSAIVESIALRIVAGTVPLALQGVEIYTLDLSQVLAGAKFKGDFEERLNAIISQVKAANGKIVLFIDEIHNLCKSGKSEGSMDAANLLKPALARGEVLCIGATTYKEYKESIEKDAALERRFQPVYVTAPDVTESITILKCIREKYELHHGIKITDEAITAAVKLSDRYITERSLPDKAIDLMDEAMASVKVAAESKPKSISNLEKEYTELEINYKHEQAKEIKQKLEYATFLWQKEVERRERLTEAKEALEEVLHMEKEAIEEGRLEEASRLRYGVSEKAKNRIKEIEEDQKQFPDQFLTCFVDEEDIASVITLWTKIPVNKILKDEKAHLLALEGRLEERVLAQDQATAKVANAIRRSRTGMADPKRPKANFMFLGPTGTGKSEMAKTLAEELFNDEKAIIRLDMSEYAEQHAVNRLIGPPPGYVGYEAGGQLTEAVRKQPFSVILLDEIEKAHRDIYKILLQLLDEGRLTDGQGKTANFSNCIIIMTTNMTHETLKVSFPPEFINRIDDIIKFEPLTQETLRKIFFMNLKKTQQKLDTMGIKLELTESAINFILGHKDEINKDDDESGYGARLIKRNVVRMVEDPISKKLLESENIGRICGDTLKTGTPFEDLFFYSEERAS